jgi:hypothetical protein
MLKSLQPQYSNKVVPSVDNYRPASADGVMGGQRRRSAAEIPTVCHLLFAKKVDPDAAQDNYERGLPHLVDAFQPNSASGRPRGDSYYINADTVSLACHIQDALNPEFHCR